MGADGFIVVGFTTPSPSFTIEEEAEAVAMFLEVIDFFHIRKKESSLAYTRRLIECIPARFHKRLILHSHYSLAEEFELGGVHNIDSVSCHSLEEVEQSFTEFTDRKSDSLSIKYAFLSPVFDSISKSGYRSKFHLKDSELIDTVSRYPVVALGGVTPEHFTILFDSKFAGAALLGYLWSPKLSLEEKIDALKKKLLQVRGGQLLYK